MAALDAELKQAGWSKAELCVCVSDHFVRYALLAWRQGLRGFAEWEAYAAHELETRFGQSRHGRIVRITPGRQGQCRLAAAMDADLLERLREVAGQARLAITAIEPNLCRVANRFRRSLQKPAAALAVSEPGRLSVLHVRNDNWASLTSVRAGTMPEHTLASLLVQARFTEGAIDDVMIWGALATDTGVLARHGLKSAPLQPPAGLPDACLSMGLI